MYDPETSLETYSDGTIAIKQRRGDPITMDGTVVTDPLRRIILAGVYSPLGPQTNSSLRSTRNTSSESQNSTNESLFSISTFSYYFQDATSQSPVC